MKPYGNASISQLEGPIGVAMSGGVDSTATALLLGQHHKVHGFFMRLAQPDFPAQLARVEQLAETLAIPLTVVDLRAQFQELVLDSFAATYFAGATPNPCMVCNHQIKFGLFLQAMRTAGMRTMATGHYARLVWSDGCYRLHDGADSRKNQSYFLSRLSQDQLRHLYFPLGEYQKDEIYQLTASHGFDFSGQESQDVCFLAAESVADFLQQRYPEQVARGPIRATDGRVLGEHHGLFRYTIGQRRGLGLPDSSPWYVVALDKDRNTLVVGKQEELQKSTIAIDSPHWLCEEPLADKSYRVKIRYNHQGSPATIACSGQDDIWLIHFATPQRAIAPGQYAVLYDGSELIGSGVIRHDAS